MNSPSVTQFLADGLPHGTRELVSGLGIGLSDVEHAMAQLNGSQALLVWSEIDGEIWYQLAGGSLIEQSYG